MWKSSTRASRELFNDTEPKRGRRWLVILFMFVIAIGGGAWAWLKYFDAAFLPIRYVNVKGEYTRVTSGQVQKIVSEHTRNTGFFSVSIKTVERSLQAVPWLKTAAVRRLWPATVEITVIEQQALARWSTGGLVNKEGQLFFPEPQTYPPGLPEFRGPDATSQLLTQRYAEMTQAIAPLEVTISKLVLDERRSWRVLLSNNVELLLGRAEQLTRLGRFIKFYAQIVAPQPATMERVDLRYTNGVAVKWKLLPETEQDQSNSKEKSRT